MSSARNIQHVQNFTRLRVWKSAHAFTLDVYKATASFPREERYGIVAQLRRSAASVSANIAEGCARGTDGGFSNFVEIAAASASEAEYQLLLSRDLNLLTGEAHERLQAQIREVGRMLGGLRRTLRRAATKPAKRIRSS